MYFDGAEHSLKVACLLALVLSLHGSLVAQQTQYVVMLVIGGVRYSETFGDGTHSFIPHVWSELRPKGVIYTSYRNEGRTETIPGHAAIATGTWQDIANDGSVRPTAPTCFEYYRFQKSATASQTFVVLGKTALGAITYSANTNYGASYGASVKYSSSQYSDLIAWTNVKMVIESFHPRLMIINFPAADNAGDSGNWEAYTSTIRTADSLVNETWNYIQADPVMKGKTTLIVTNDHGRHLDGWSTGFQESGDGCDGCRHLMLLIIGPDTPAGIIDSTTTLQVDVAPTVGKLLGFTVPTAIGKVLTSAIVTAVDEPPNLSRQAELCQNYPNPFNPTTVIRYQLPVASEVRLEVYDMLGREVSVLAHERKAAGFHEARFDGSNVTSGVYFYRLEARPTDGGQAGAFVQTRKLLLVR
jgi:hypothetical protein